MAPRSSFNIALRAGASSVAEIRQDGREALCIFRNVIKPNERDVDELEDGQARVGVAPTPAQISPDPMGENLGERALGVFADHGACLGIQHPMDTRVLVARGEPKRLHNPQTEFVLGHAIFAGVQNGSQDRAAQQTDEQKVIEVTRLECGILPVVRETEQLAFLFGNAAVRSRSSIPGRSRREVSWPSFGLHRTGPRAWCVPACWDAAGRGSTGRNRTCPV